MEDKQVLLFELLLDIPNVEENAKKAKNALAQLRQEKEITQKAFSSGSLGEETYKKTISALNTEIGKTEKQLASYNRIIADNDKAQKAASESVAKMRTGITAATQVNIGLENRIKSLAGELKNEESAAKSSAGGIEQYAQSIESAITGNNTWTGGIRSTVQTLASAKNNLTQYVSGLQATTQGMSLAEKASVGLGIGLKAMGIGLIITAIAGLISFLSRMDAGMDKVEQATAGLAAGFEAFLKVLAPVGEAIVDAFTHPLDSILTFTKALINPGDALLKLGKAAIGMGQEVSESVGKAASAAVAYTKAMQDLEDRQDSIIGVQAKVNEQVQLALISAKDRSKSEAERIKLLDEAGKAEMRLAREVVAIEKGKYDKLKEYQAGLTQLQDADRKKSREAYAAYVNARAASAQTEQQIQNRRSSLIEQEIAENKRLSDEAKKEAQKRAQARVDEAEAALIVARRKGEDTIEIEQELAKRQLDVINVKTAAEKAAVEKGTGYNAKIKLIEAKAATERIELAKATALKIADITFNAQMSAIETSLTFTRAGSKQELNLLIEGINAARVKQQQAARLTIQDKFELAKEDARLVATGQKKIDDLRIAFDRNQALRKAEDAERTLQMQLDLGDESIVVQRQVDAKRIELEETTQIALLKIDKKYGQVTDEEYEKRLKEINAKRVKSEQDLARQLAADARSEQKALADSALAIAKEGSKAQLAARLKDLRIQRDAELANAQLTMKATNAITLRYKRAEEDEETRHRNEQIDKIQRYAGQMTGIISNLFEAQQNATAQLIDNQQEAALQSAGLSAEARQKIEEKYGAKRQEAERKAAEQRRKIAEVEVIINTATAIAKVAGNPLLIALAAITGAAQLALIESQKFARGGVIDGPSHQQGGVKYQLGYRTVELEGGEGVINKRSMAIPGVAQKASELNQLGRGVVFPGTMRVATGWTPPPVYNASRLELGGILNGINSVNATTTNVMATIDQKALGQTVSKMVVEAVKSLPPSVVQVVDIQNKVARKVQVDNRASA